jgi:hypothetical protein
MLNLLVPVRRYRAATGWVHLGGVKCMKYFMHGNTTNHTLCMVVYIMYYGSVHCVRKVTSCLSPGMAAHKFGIKYYSIQYCITKLEIDP